jgi:L-threonylcarbamoyladenylate synthase
MTFRLSPQELSTASDLLRSGGTVAFPTETVYGLGADATNPAAVARIFQAKGRPADNPLIVHLYHRTQLESYCRSIPALADTLIARFCPGPLTLVLPKRATIPEVVTAGMDSVAIRFPAHPTARRLLEQCQLPLAAPSANRSGRPSATTWQAVLEDLDGTIDAVICDDPADIGLESTVLDLTQAPPTILRAGSVTLKELQLFDPSISECLSTAASSQANSPGLRHRHYQPHAQVRLCQSPRRIPHLPLVRQAYIGIEPVEPQAFALVRICRDLPDYAHALFDFFRRCDHQGIDSIWCQQVTEQGLGKALTDRLERAASTQATPPLP